MAAMLWKIRVYLFTSEQWMKMLWLSSLCPSTTAFLWKYQTFSIFISSFIKRNYIRFKKIKINLKNWKTRKPREFVNGNWGTARILPNSGYFCPYFSNHASFLRKWIRKGVRVLHGAAPPEELGSWAWGWEQSRGGNETTHEKPSWAPFSEMHWLFYFLSFPVKTGRFFCGHSIFLWLSHGDSLISSNAMHGWENTRNGLQKEYCLLILLQQTGKVS